MKCLDQLKKSDLDEVKALGKPPQRVKLVMESACVMFQVKPDRVRHPDDDRKKINDYFAPSKKHLLNDPKGFLQRMKDSKPDAMDMLVDGKQISILRPVLHGSLSLTTSSSSFIVLYDRVACSRGSSVVHAATSVREIPGQTEDPWRA